MKVIVVNTVIIDKTGYKFDQSKISQGVEEAVTKDRVQGDVEVEVALIGAGEMADLHQKYLRTHETTDVMSFPTVEVTFGEEETVRKQKLEAGRGPDGVLRLGDIVICVEVAARQAQEKKHSLEREMVFLVKHGVTHLLGKHHRE